MKPSGQVEEAINSLISWVSQLKKMNISSSGRDVGQPERDAQ